MSRSVSLDVDKDYVDAPRLYAELGVGELVVFDPKHEEEPDRYRFQVYRKVGKRGLVRALVTNEDRVRSKALGCTLRAVGHGDELRLRLATGAAGDAIVPSEGELAERALADKERERAMREALQEEVHQLRAQLDAKIPSK